LTSTTFPRSDASDTSRPSRSRIATTGAAAGLRKKRSVTRAPFVPVSDSARPLTCREKRLAAQVMAATPITKTRSSERRLDITDSSVS
jgi:hypothetical protein